MATFVAFGAYRSFLFATAAAFFIQAFGAQNLGRVYGAALSMAALTSFAQYPLLQWGLGSAGFLGPNVVVLLTTLASASLPLYVGAAAKEASAAGKASVEDSPNTKARKRALRSPKGRRGTESNIKVKKRAAAAGNYFPGEPAVPGSPASSAGSPSSPGGRRLSPQV